MMKQSFSVVFPAPLSSSHLVPHLQVVVVLSFLITKTISEAVSPLLSPYDVQIGGKALGLSLHQLLVFSGRVVQ